MKTKQLKIAFLISLLVSSIVSFPRMLKPSLNDLSIILGHFFYMLFLCLIFGLIAQWAIQKKDRKIFSLTAFLLASGIISIIYQQLVLLIKPDFTPLFSDIPLIEELSKRQLNVLMFFRGIFFSVFIYLVVYYLDLIGERQNARLVIEELKKEKLEAQLNSLKQQISPHFLFNSLSTLKTIVTDNKSKEFILKLSNVYRYLLSFKESNLTTLDEELEFIQSYLYILHERFEGALIVSIEIDQALGEKRLPPLSIQLLLENAIKHNVVSLDEPLEVKIYNESDKQLVILNNLQPKLNTEESTGRGLENINKRYKILADTTIDIYRTDTTFAVKIPLLNENEIKI